MGKQSRSSAGGGRGRHFFIYEQSSSPSAAPPSGRFGTAPTLSRADNALTPSSSSASGAGPVGAFLTCGGAGDSYARSRIGLCSRSSHASHPIPKAPASWSVWLGARWDRAGDVTLTRRAVSRSANRRYTSPRYTVRPGGSDSQCRLCVVRRGQADCSAWGTSRRGTGSALVPNWMSSTSAPRSSQKQHSAKASSPTTVVAPT